MPLSFAKFLCEAAEPAGRWFKCQRIKGPGWSKLRHGDIAYMRKTTNPGILDFFIVPLTAETITASAAKQFWKIVGVVPDKQQAELSSMYTQELNKFLVEYSWRDVEIKYPNVYQAIIKKPIRVSYDTVFNPGDKNIYIAPVAYSSKVRLMRSGSDPRSMDKWVGFQCQSWEKTVEFNPDYSLMQAVDIGAKITDLQFISLLRTAEKYAF